MPLKKQTEKTNNEQSKPYNQMQLFYKMHFFPNKYSTICLHCLITKRIKTAEGKIHEETNQWIKHVRMKHIKLLCDTISWNYSNERVKYFANKWIFLHVLVVDWFSEIVWAKFEQNEMGIGTIWKWNNVENDTRNAMKSCSFKY